MFEAYVFRIRQKLFIRKVDRIYMIFLLFLFFQLLLLLFTENKCLDNNVCECCEILINLCIMKIRFSSNIFFLIKTKTWQT